jgi:dihydropteroate synthase
VTCDLFPAMAVHRATFVIPLPGGRTLELGRRTLVMGVVNITPDSFAGGVRGEDQAIALALSMEADGADLIDIGGESTRPGAAAVTEADERARVIPVIERLSHCLTVPLSVDTYKAGVAAAAIDAGACIVNDVSGLEYDPQLGAVVARTGAGLVLMHNRGRSRDMYREARYDDVAGEVASELGGSLARAATAGVDRARIILDPGIGFAKRAEHSWSLLAELPRIAALDRPLLVGVSRKSFLTEALGTVPPEERDWGTAAAVTYAVLQGAHVVRVHAVKAMVHAVRVADTTRRYAGDASGRVRSSGDLGAI